MIRDALDNTQFTPNAMQRVEREMLCTKSTKTLVPSAIAALIVGVLLMLTNPVLANPLDYTRWGLPEGAKARIGKGTFTDMQLSPDGTRLAIASSAGVWLYDVSTGDEIALITENTGSHWTGYLFSRWDNTRHRQWGQHMSHLGC